jgi:hypothetical protein
MTDKEFYDWFVERAEMFAQLGIMHPKSEWGKTVKIALMVSESRMKELEARIDELEATIKQPAPEKPKRTRKPKVNQE